MAITLRSGKEPLERKEVEKTQMDDKAERKYQNSTSSNKGHSRNGLSDENQQLKEQGELAIEKLVQKKEEVRAYQPPIPFSQRLKQSKLDN